MHSILRRALVAALFLLASCSGSGQTRDRMVESGDGNAVPPLSPAVRGAEDPLPLDPAVRSARLSNGLRYLIRENKRPENRAELRLVVNVGSILEDDDQLGLAHFVEHMAFNGTRHFEKQALVEYLESIGMRFGADVNAYTSFDETVYMLQLPTDSTETLHTGFQILRDWAGELSFDPTEIDKERGVVIEEWRTHRGAAARLQDKQLPVILKDSRYAERLPIGSTDILESFNPETLVRYYRDWYRPELMTVVAVGDFDSDEIEAWIRQQFSDLTPPSHPRERIYYDVPDNQQALYTIESDPEETSAVVSVYYKHSPWAEGTRTSYRNRLRSSLYTDMFNQRLNELTQSTNPPYVAAGSSDGELVRTRSAYTLAALAKDGDYLGALHTLLREAERVRRYGFTETELERAKTERLRSLEIAFNERDNTNSSVFASELIRHVLTKEAVPGVEYEYSLAAELLPTISVDEVNRLLSTLVTERNQVISISGPQNDAEPLPSVDAVSEVFAETLDESIDPYVDMVDDQPLVDTIPSPGSITEERYDERIGTTFLTLSNGVQVVLKPTDFKKDQVLVRATSPGGVSLASDRDYLSASFSSQLIGASGVGRYGPIELEKKLAGKAVQISPVISSLSEGFSGSASPKDLETLFQLVYLYGTTPRADSVVFASYMTRLQSVLSASHSSPRSAFSDTLSVTLSQYHFRARPLSEDMLGEISFGESLDFFRDRFADFSDFTFYIVGSIDLDAIRPLLTTYIATLPSTHRQETWKDEGVRTPDGVVTKTVVKGIDPVSQVAIVFSGDAEWSIEARHRMYMLEEVVNTRLREILREDLGGTYGVSVSGSLSDRPTETYRFSISFGCSPDRVDELVEQVFSEIRRLKQEPPAENYVANGRESAIRDFEVGIKENGYWLSSLLFYQERNMNPDAILDGPDTWVNTISAADVTEAAKKYLSEDRYVKVTLVPEGSSE